MDRKQLMDMGLSEEQAAKVMQGLDGSFVPKDRFNQINTELKTAKAALTAAQQQEAQANTQKQDGDALKAQIAALQADLIARDKQHAEAIAQMQMDAAIDKALQAAGARNAKAVRALLDTSALECLADGTVKGLDAQVKALTDAEDTKFLFGDAEAEKPTFRGVSPGESRDGLPGSGIAQYASQLKAARDVGDQIAAIRIKQAAIAEGISLI